MSKLGDLDTTGRRIDGPAADLVECVNEKGLKFTAIEFHEHFRGHPDVEDRVEKSLDFLRKPGVEEIVPLTEYLEDEGALLYPTGTGWSVAEMVRVLADVGEVGGVRAGLELAYRASQALMDAAEAGEKHEVWNHGNVNPWTLFVKPDGTVKILGYGIPQVEICTFLDDESEMPEEDSFRYCPPERLEGEEEDISTDLFSLTLVAVELMIGRPVYDGLVNDLHQQAIRAEGSYRLYKWRDQLPETVREVLSRAIKYDLDARHHDPLDFVYAVHDILGSLDAEGMTLAEAVGIVRRETSTGDAPITGGATTMLTKAELARLAGDLEEVEAAPLDAPRRPRPSDEPEEDEDDDEPSRWGNVKRGGGGRRGRKGKEAEAPKAPKAAPPAGTGGDDRRDRLRSRLGRSGGSDANSGGDDKKSDLRSRLRGGRDRDGDRGGGADKRDALRDRLRRSRDDEGEKDPRGSKRDALRSRLRRSEDGPPSRSSDNKKDVLRDRLRRSRDEPEDIEEDDDSEELDDAAALLARLRSSIGSSTDEEDDESEEVDDDESEEVDDDSEDVDDDESEDVDDDATADDEEDVQDEATADGDDDEDVDDDATADEVSEEAPAPSPTPTPSPTPAAAVTTADAGLSFDVKLNGRRSRASLQPDTTIADAASELIAKMGGVPTDLTGQLTGWYRIQQKGTLLKGSDRVSALDAGERIELSFVPNDVVRVTFEVEGLETPMRFSAPVGTAVPAGSLIQHLSHWLKLPDSGWRLYVGDKLLGPAQILAEFGPKDEIVVVVRK